MQASAATPGNIPTIFVGIVDGTKYTNEMWEHHKNLLACLFGITEMAQWVREIKVQGLSARVVDGSSLQQQFREAMDVINRSCIKCLRIVGLGVGSSDSVTEALASLIREWNIPKREKEVQFVALGESPDYHYLNFCKSLCMKEECKHLQYYNTMDFNEQGYFRENKMTGLASLMPLLHQCVQQ
jgi:hypothetical protein